MKYKPHDYQKYVTEFILSHPVAAIILQMGLGKTVCTLDAINQLMYDTFEISKVLVIAPLRVAKVTWSDEIKKWDNLSHLRYSIAVGTEKERTEALERDADIYIINRENLQWLVEKSGVPFEYDMVVIDELSSFKNWNSKRFKAFMQVRPRIKRVIGLTGTPSPNGMMDLFAQFKCLDMGERLGRFITQYRNCYFTPDRMNRQIVYSYKLRPGAEDQIYNKISDITISMKAMDHLNMPELIENRYPVYMDEQEQMLYDEMRKEFLDNVSHELKTPLTSIVGYLELIKKEELSDVVRDYVDVISTRAGKLGEMINSLFSLAKASSGNVELHKETFELNRLMEQIFADMDDRIKESGLKFVTQFTEEDTAIYSDNSYFYRICQNLVENALKYSAKGTRVFVKTYKKEAGTDQKIVLEITNTSGYEMDFEKEDIIERFSRGDKARTSEGNGLGLAIVSTYAKALGGEFDIKIDCDQFKAIVSI